MESPRPEDKPRGRRGGKAYIILATVASLGVGGWLALRWYGAGKQSTDDAQIEADVVPVSARVGGVIKTAYVHDNDLVKAGAKLFELDPADLAIEVKRTDAELKAAKAQQAAAAAQVAIVEQGATGDLSSAKATLVGAGASVRSASDAIRAAEAGVARARADLANADSELGRVKELFAKQAITGRDLERAQQVHDVAQAAFDAATAQLDLARSQRGMAQAKVAEAQGHVTHTSPVDQQIAAARAASSLADARVEGAEVAFARAQLNASYTTVYAPADGIVSRLGAHPGQTVAAGQALLMLVPTDTYVIANFKESQVGAMKINDKVDISLDAYDGTFAGFVETISPATGARFSMIPPDNATGNFVKVVQRVPVKIRWAQKPTIAMRPGLSAEVTVHVAE
ncbi:MAG: HlyD family secretion protein [Deltaproteobacteria bacterium]|nr:HlyD family secretion protein [Deltaproteobacteria bacterium]